MNLSEYIEARKTGRSIFWKKAPNGAEHLLDEAIEEITRLRCDAVECHQGRDVLASLYEAIRQLPCCGTAAIIGAATQEIQGLRDAIRRTLEESGHLADGDNCTLRHLVRADPRQQGE